MDAAILVKLLNVVALAVMMLSIGLTVDYEQVVVSARQPRLVVLALVANFVLVPLVTVGLLAAFRAQPLVSAGFLILAVCPGAPVGPQLTALAKGNVALSTGLMVILAALSALLSPVLLGILLAGLAPGGELRVDYVAIVRTLLVTQLLPLVVGLGIHHRAPGLTRRIARPVGMLANVLLIVLVGMIVVAQHETLAVIRSPAWAGMILLLLASLSIGWACGWRDASNRRALAMTTASRNVAVGLVIAVGNFAGTPAVTAVVAFGLVSIIGALGFALLSGGLVGEPSKGARSTS